MLNEVPFSETAEAYDGVIRGIALPNDRKPQARGDVCLPEGTIVVSADNHWSVHQDIFYDRFPDHLKHKAPRWDPAERVFTFDGESELTQSVRKSIATYEAVPGVAHIAPRLRDMDIEGVDKEMNFPNTIPAFFGYPDLEVREWIFRIYNEHLVEMQAAAPGRFYGAAMLNFWDLDKVRDAVFEIKAMGLKAINLPQTPKGANGAQLNYCLTEMDPLWAAIEEADLPICFHVGEFYKDGPGGHGTTIMVSFGPYRKNFGELVFGGVFDRFPKLQVVFLEAEINWVPGALQTASMAYECFGSMLEPKIQHHPRHYWFNNCYAAFTHDPAGLRMLDLVGADRVMWSSDYPHLESTFGYNWDSLKSVVDAAATEDDARAMLGGTAMKVFKL